ncbi:MAG: MerR family transcriptional regulator [Acidimicrobiia bacterium]
MDGYRISAAARATGFTVSALRFYEQEGVVVPERTPTGYRSYREDHLESLRFVARGKQLGLSLNDITELLELLDEEECAPVQTRIRHLVHQRIGQAHDQIAELMAFTAQLQTAAARLGVHTPDGACDDDCGCRSEPRPGEQVDSVKLIPLTGTGAGDIACSLNPESVGARIDDWNRLLTSATTRVSVPNGIRIGFDNDVDVAALAELAAAEQDCCSFFDFDIGIGSGGVSLEVSGPDDSQEIISAMFGAAA